MPFCCQCGFQVDPADSFCGRCGARQVMPAAAEAQPEPAGPAPRATRPEPPPPPRPQAPPPPPYPPPPYPPRPAGPIPTTDPLENMNPRTAAILCYVPAIGWIAAIVVLASQRFRHNREIRFHAFQGLYLFVAWLMADWVLRPMLFAVIPHVHLDRMVQAVLLGMSVFMMIKAAHDEAYALPLFGELAQRSVVEN